MEVDTRAARGVNHAHASLQANVESCLLCPSTVKLHQYDGTTLPPKVEIEVVVTTNQQSITGKFVVIADISNDQLPLAVWERLHGCSN